MPAIVKPTNGLEKIFMASNFSKKLVVPPDKKVKLANYDPEETLGWQKGHAMKASLAKTLTELDSLQYRLYAEKNTLCLSFFKRSTPEARMAPFAM